jgi:hypothetical protein
MKFFFVLFLASTSLLYTYAQRNLADFYFLKSVLQNNYPGFSIKTDSARFNSYLDSILLSKEDNSDEFTILSKIPLFFEDYHLQLSDITVEDQYNKNYCDSMYSITTEYLNAKKLSKKGMEGYWVNILNNCIIGIKKSNSGTEQYTGVVVASAFGIKNGFPVCFFYNESNGKLLTKYTDPEFIYSFFTYSSLNNGTVLKTGIDNIWRKISKDDFSSVKKNLKKESYEPTFLKLNTTTVVISIPSMNGSYAAKVDSILSKFDSTIQASKTLIIDVRNNMGGTARTYFPLFKYVYTDTIFRQSTSVFCSNSYLEYTSKYVERFRTRKDTTGLKREEDELDLLIKNRGSYIDKPSQKIILNSTLKYPENIAILINHSSLSAAESMLLDFMQSKKVKVFGQPTGGAVDYVGVYSLELPSKKYYLKLPSVIRKGYNGNYQNLDIKGIQPDVLIKNQAVDWYKFVISYYGK